MSSYSKGDSEDETETNENHYTNQKNGYDCRPKRKVKICKMIDRVKVVEEERDVLHEKKNNSCARLKESLEKNQESSEYTKDHVLYLSFCNYIPVDSLPYRGSFKLPNKKMIRSVEIQYENKNCFDLKFENENFNNFYIKEKNSNQKPFVGYLLRAKNKTNRFDHVPVKHSGVGSEKNFVRYGGVEHDDNNGKMDCWMFKTKEHKWVINAKTPAMACFIDNVADKSSKNSVEYEGKNLIVKEPTYNKVKNIMFECYKNVWYTDTIDFVLSPFSEGKKCERSENNINQPETCLLTGKLMEKQKKKEKRVSFVLKITSSDVC